MNPSKPSDRWMPWWITVAILLTTAGWLTYVVPLARVIFTAENRPVVHVLFYLWVVAQCVLLSAIFAHGFPRWGRRWLLTALLVGSLFYAIFAYWSTEGEIKDVRLCGLSVVTLFIWLLAARHVARVDAALSDPQPKSGIDPIP